MRIDLHVHSTASDGALSPAAVVTAAVRGRLDVLALADHDTIDGFAEAVDAARSHRIEVVPALEVSSTEEGRELHILGYFVDPGHPTLQGYQARAQSRRRARLESMVERLATVGVEVPFSSVLDAAGGGRATLGRPHLAQALVDHGYVRVVSEAFDRWIGDDHPAFVPTDLGSPAEAFAMIREAGGVPVWAHPPFDLLDDSRLRTFRDAGLEGLEVYRPRTSSGRVLELERMVRRFDLLRSGGSDWHGPGALELGDFFVTGDEVGRLLTRGGL